MRTTGRQPWGRLPRAISYQGTLSLSGTATVDIFDDPFSYSLSGSSISSPWIVNVEPGSIAAVIYQLLGFEIGFWSENISGTGSDTKSYFVDTFLGAGSFPVVVMPSVDAVFIPSSTDMYGDYSFGTPNAMFITTLNLEYHYTTLPGPGTLYTPPHTSDPTFTINAGRSQTVSQ